MVRAAAFVLQRRANADRFSTFFNLLNDDEKASALVSVLSKTNSHTPDNRIFQVDQDLFGQLEQKSFAYWAGATLLKRFRPRDSFGQIVGPVVLGAVTSDNERFLRLHWEVDPTQADTFGWRAYPKGGDFRKYYRPIHLVISWWRNGEQIQAAGVDAVRLLDVSQ